MLPATKEKIALQIKHWFVVSAILWVSYMAYMLIFHGTEKPTATFDAMLELFVLFTKIFFYPFVLYILPKYGFKFLCKLGSIAFAGVLYVIDLKLETTDPILKD